MITPLPKADRRRGPLPFDSGNYTENNPPFKSSLCLVPLCPFPVHSWICCVYWPYSDSGPPALPSQA